MSRLRYYTPREIALHSTADDLWVSLNGNVLDLTPLVKDKDADEIFPLLAFAGKDISHLLDDEEVKLHVDPVTSKISPFCPFKTLLGAPPQKEAEELFLERKRQEEEAVKGFMEKYMSGRIGKHRKKSVPREEKHEITNDQTSEDIQRTEHLPPLSAELSAQQKMPETTPSETDHTEEQHSETDRSIESSTELEQEITEQPESSEQKPVHHKVDDSSATFAEEKLNLSERSLPQENQTHGTDSSEKECFPTSLKEDVEENILGTSSQDNSVPTTESNEKDATESPALQENLYVSEEKEMVHNETGSFSGKETQNDEKSVNGRKVSEEKLAEAALPTDADENLENNSRDEQNESDATETSSGSNEPSKDSSRNFLQAASSKEVIASSESTPADDQETEENSDKEQNAININLSSTPTENEKTVDASENLTPVSEEESFSEESSMGVSTDEDGESLDTREKQSEGPEAEMSDSKMQESSKDLSSDSSEGVENVTDASLPATDNQDLDESEGIQEINDPSTEQEQPNNDAPEITFTDEYPDDGIPKHSTESHAISSHEQQPSHADGSAKASSEELEPCESTSPEQEPDHDGESPSTEPWWKDSKYVVGLLTEKPRWVKIFNTIIMQEVKIEVCREDTISDILERYLKFNSNASNYTWKHLGMPLNMHQTLEENGIPDHEDVATRFRLNPEYFIPTLHLYYNESM